VQIFEHNFYADKEKVRRNTDVLQGLLTKFSMKICKKDVRRKILNRLLNAGDYFYNKTKQVPKSLLNMMKSSLSGVKRNELDRILVFSASGKESKTVYIPSNNSLLEDFMLNSDYYFYKKEEN